MCESPGNARIAALSADQAPTAIIGCPHMTTPSGPFRIAEVSGAMAKIGLGALLALAAIMSISVGMLNLFPIPLLDGGHLFYYGVEVIRGKAMNEKAQQFGSTSASRW
jgi:membrane-associated protease RseP (regulator of RpoE activity)